MEGAAHGPLNMCVLRHLPLKSIFNCADRFLVTRGVSLLLLLSFSLTHTHTHTVQPCDLNPSSVNLIIIYPSANRPRTLALNIALEIPDETEI